MSVTQNFQIWTFFTLKMSTQNFCKCLKEITKMAFPGLPDFAKNIQPKTKLYNHLALQFSDFQLKSFVDPKPVEL